MSAIPALAGGGLLRDAGAGSASHDGARRKRRSKVPVAVDTPGHLLAPARHPGRCRRLDRGQAPRGRHPGRNRRERPVGLRRPGVGGRDGRRSCRGRGHRAARRQAARSQTGFRSVTVTMGRGAVLRLGNTLPQAGQGSRAPRRNPRRLPRHGLRRIHAQTRCRTDAKHITLLIREGSECPFENSHLVG